MINLRVPGFRLRISLLSISQSAYSVGHNGFQARDIPQQFPLPQELNRESGGDQQGRKESDGDISLLIVWSVYLLPNYEWQPRLQDIGHLVHGRHHNCSFLVVFLADFMCPSELCLVSDNSSGRWMNSRHT